MFKARDIEIRVVSQATASGVVKRFHYSGKVTQNSQIHFGVFLNGTIQGALQFGPSIDKRRMAGTLGVGFNEFLELNRMALSDVCPKNSESRALGVCLRMLKKRYPFLRVIVSFADACQCGDGTIYRAAGFKLESFKKNNSLLVDPDGNIEFNHGTKKRPNVVAKKAMDNRIDPATGQYESSVKKLKALEGFQMKYLYFFDQALAKRFTFVDRIPDEVRMYKGARSKASVAAADQVAEDGATPILALQSEKLPDD